MTIIEALQAAGKKLNLAGISSHRLDAAAARIIEVGVGS